VANNERPTAQSKSLFMDIFFNKIDESEEFETEERCHILELFNSSQDRSQSLARARVAPGVTTAWHRLRDTSEVYYILSGTGVVEIGEEYTKEIQAGDTFKIPRDAAQRVRNTGDDDLLFLCYCVPAFGDESYEALE